MRPQAPEQPTIGLDGSLAITKDRPTAGDFVASTVLGGTLVAGSTLALAWYADNHRFWTTTQTATVLGLAIGGLIAAGLGFVVDARRAARGVWHLDADQVEFVESDGSRRGLRWDEVDHVQFRTTSICLVGPLRRLRIDRGRLDEATWHRVGDRIKTELDARCEWTPPVIDQRLRLPVVLATSAPFAAATVWFRNALGRLDPRQIYLGVLVIVAILGLSTIVPIWFVGRDHSRRTWRHRRDTTDHAQPDTSKADQ